MSLRRHLKVFGATLATLVVSVMVTTRVADTGYDGAPALAVLIALIVVGGVVADSIERPRPADAAIIIVLFTLLGWLWQYMYPAGEQSGTGWFARGGWALPAVSFTSLWLVGVAVHATATRRQRRIPDVPILLA